MIKSLFKQILATIIVFITIVISTSLSFSNTLPIRVPYILFKFDDDHYVTIDKKNENLYVVLNKCIYKDFVKIKVAPHRVSVLIKKDSVFFKLADKILDNQSLIITKAKDEISNSTPPNGFIVSKDRDRMPIDMTLTETRQLIDFLTPYIEKQKERTSQNPECWQNIFH